MFAGQVIAGFWLSLTVTVKVHIAMLLEASFAVQVTVVVPLRKLLPEDGVHVTVAPEQLSDAVGTVYVTFAAQVFGAVFVVMFVGQVTVGFCVSLTVTVKVQVPVRLEASVAVQVTVVVPTLKVEPVFGTQATVAPGQLSEAVGTV